MNRGQRIAGALLQATVLGVLLAVAVFRWLAADATASFHYEGF